MKTPPCYNCPDRKVGCHTAAFGCTKNKEYKDSIPNNTDANTKAATIRSYQIDHIYATKKRCYSARTRYK